MFEYLDQGENAAQGRKRIWQVQPAQLEMNTARQALAAVFAMMYRALEHRLHGRKAQDRPSGILVECEQGQGFFLVDRDPFRRAHSISSKTCATRYG